MVSKQIAERPVVDVPALPDEYIPGITQWNDGADTVTGHDLLGTDTGLIDALIGVPFMVTRVTFNAGRGVLPDGTQKAMASVEAVIAPEDVLKRRRVNMAELPFEPDDQIVFNDGSTGIYRQIVAYLAAKGWITVPEGETSGSVTVYDLPPSRWVGVNVGELVEDKSGFARYTLPLRLTCPRGLRKSLYTTENFGDAATRYIA